MERLEHEYERFDTAVGDTVRAWQDDTILARHLGDGRNVDESVPGAVRVRVGQRSKEAYGQRKAQDIYEWRLPLSHFCTNPDCQRPLWPASMCRAFTGELPDWAHEG